MKIHGYNIDFINCTPDDLSRQAASNVASKIKFKAPSNSRINIALEYVDGIYLGYCRIGSKSGIFVSRSKSADLIDCINQLEDNAYQQLQAWNEQRQSDFKATAAIAK